MTNGRSEMGYCQTGEIFGGVGGITEASA